MKHSQRFSLSLRVTFSPVIARVKQSPERSERGSDEAISKVKRIGSGAGNLYNAVETNLE